MRRCFFLPPVSTGGRQRRSFGTSRGVEEGRKPTLVRQALGYLIGKLGLRQLSAVLGCRLTALLAQQVEQRGFGHPAKEHCIGLPFGRHVDAETRQDVVRQGAVRIDQRSN